MAGTRIDQTRYIIPRPYHFDSRNRQYGHSVTDSLWAAAKLVNVSPTTEFQDNCGFCAIAVTPTTFEYLPFSNSNFSETITQTLNPGEWLGVYGRILVLRKIVKASKKAQVYILQPYNNDHQP